MRKILAGLLITFSVFFAVGYTVAEKTEKIKISTRTDDKRPTEYFVIATLPPVIPEHRWLDVWMCAAIIDVDAHAQCDPAGWAAGSGKAPRIDQRQYEVPFRHVPMGPKLILAEVINQDRKVLASGRKVVLR